jgi:hypothetical protein
MCGWESYYGMKGSHVSLPSRLNKYVDQCIRYGLPAELEISLDSPNTTMVLRIGAANVANEYLSQEVNT